MSASRRRPRPTLLVPLLLLALTACGSTVQPGEQSLSQLPADAGQGLGARVGGEQPQDALGDGSTSVGGAGLDVNVSGSNNAAAAVPGSASGPARAAGAPTQGGSAAVPADTAAAAAELNTSPITLGVLAAGDPQEGAKQAGGDSGTSASAKQTLRAVLDHYKKQGGIAGRPIKEIFRDIPVTTTDYNTHLQSMCSLFTEDNEADVVVSGIGFYSAAFTQCLDRAGTPHIEGAYGGTDAEDFNRYRSYYTPNHATYDARFNAVVRAGVEAGRLTRGMKVGVVIEDCPQIQRAFNGSFVPAAKAVGLVLDTFTHECVEGFKSAGGLAAGNQSAVTRFRTNGVETVMFATHATGVDLAFFTPAASSQGWQPKYWLDSLGVAATGQSSGQYAADQVPQMAGAGWLEVFDISKPTHDSPAQKRCLGIVQQRVPLKTTADFYLAYAACDAFFLLEAALLKSGGGAEPDALRAGVAAVGTSPVLSAISGRTSLSESKRAGALEWRPFSYKAGCRCFEYTGRPRAYA